MFLRCYLIPLLFITFFLLTIVSFTFYTLCQYQFYPITFTYLLDLPHLTGFPPIQGFPINWFSFFVLFFPLLDFSFKGFPLYLFPYLLVFPSTDFTLTYVSPFLILTLTAFFFNLSGFLFTTLPLTELPSAQQTLELYINAVI